MRSMPGAMAPGIAAFRANELQNFGDDGPREKPARSIQTGVTTMLRAASPLGDKDSMALFAAGFQFRCGVFSCAERSGLLLCWMRRCLPHLLSL